MVETYCLLFANDVNPTYAFEITESAAPSLSVALNQLGHLLNLVYPTGSRQELGLLCSQFYVPTIWG